MLFVECRFRKALTGSVVICLVRKARQKLPMTWCVPSRVLDRVEAVHGHPVEAERGVCFLVDAVVHVGVHEQVVLLDERFLASLERRQHLPQVGEDASFKFPPVNLVPEVVDIFVPR